MRHILIMSSILMISCVVLAQEAETCADGAGEVITGAITGHKYCKSNNYMNWWNAYAWCEGLRMKMIDFDVCECSKTIANCANNKCAEFSGVGRHNHGWMISTSSANKNYRVRLDDGYISSIERTAYDQGNLFALCKTLPHLGNMD